MDAKDLLEKLTLEDIIQIIESLGAKVSERSNEEQIIFQSICHHDEPNEGDYKLYYYIESGTFYCYQKCGSLSLFDIIMQSKKTNFKGSMEYIFNTTFTKHKPKRGVGNKRHYTPTPLEDIIVEPLEPIKKQFVYQAFSKESIQSWLDEGISKESMDKFNIRYDKKNNRVVIPHFRADGKLIGVRVRNMNPYEAEKYGKYVPMYYNGVQYSHPLGLNLYGINIAKENIMKYKKVIIFEGEKSVLKYETMYPNNSVAVAMCGSSFSNTQKKMLIDLGVEEIVLALDKQYQVDGDEESVLWEKKIFKITNNLVGKVRVSYLWDSSDLLNYKDSPIDQGKKIFEKLLKNRKFI